MFIAVLVFVAILAILILVHEFGHFLVAKRANARVEEFGIGFPPRIFGIKRGETIYSLNLFPIGGFVKIYGEDGEKKSDSRSFASKSIGTRALIISAGVVMNVLLAVVLLSWGHFIGLPQVIDGKEVGSDFKNISVRIAAVAENSPASEAGIQIGDVVRSMSAGEDEIPDVKNIEDVQSFTNTHIEETIILTITRGKEIFKKEVLPRVSPPEGEGPIGFAMIKTGDVSYPFYLAPIKGIESTFFLVSGTLKAFGNIFLDLVKTGQFKGELAGPIGIAVLTGQVQKMGFIFLLQFMALISVNLAIINIFPFPALDGGRLLFLGIEKLKGSPVNQKYEKIAHTVGFALLIFLMIVITVRDIGRFL